MSKVAQAQEAAEALRGLKTHPLWQAYEAWESSLLEQWLAEAASVDVNHPNWAVAKAVAQGRATGLKDLRRKRIDLMDMNQLNSTQPGGPHDRSR